MTHNQINYWNLQESKRHNVVTETETNRHNVATENIDLGRLQETTRHNLATEGETNRHNVRTEGQTDVNLGLQQGTLSEVQRHNLASEQLGYGNLNLGYGQLTEQQRHNVSTESIQKFQAVSQDELNKARSQLLQTQNDWEALQQSANVTLTEAKVRQINKLNDEVDSQIKQIEWNIKKGQIDAAFKVYEEMLKGLDSLSGAVDALIPG